VNPETHLRDEARKRHFWPLRSGTIDIAALAHDRDRLWTEAVHRFPSGAIWWIDDPALLAEAREEQDRRYQSDASDDPIEHWLTQEIRTVSGGFPDHGNSRTESVPRPERLADVSVGETLKEAIGLEPARWTRGDETRVSAYLEANGWARYRRVIFLLLKLCLANPLKARATTPHVVFQPL